MPWLVLLVLLLDDDLLIHLSVFGKQKAPHRHWWGAWKFSLGKHNYQMTLLSLFCFLTFFRVRVALEFVFIGRQFNKGWWRCQLIAGKVANE